MGQYVETRADTMKSDQGLLFLEPEAKSIHEPVLGFRLHNYFLDSSGEASKTASRIRSGRKDPNIACFALLQIPMPKHPIITAKKGALTADGTKYFPFTFGSRHPFHPTAYTHSSHYFPFHSRFLPFSVKVNSETFHCL
jgi:hypothetical protein